MHETKTQKEKYRLFFKIFFPILIYQLANFSASFIDTMMTGQYSTEDLAGVSMAVSLWNPFFSLLTGIVSALVPIIAHHLGRRQKEKVRHELHQFIYLSGFLVLILFLIILLGAMPTLEKLGLESHVLTVGRGYLGWLLLGLIPLLLFSVFRSFFDSLGMTRLSMYLMLLLVPFNSFFNYVLIYGKFGVRAMGGAGAGLGTALAYWLLLVVVICVTIFHPKLQSYDIWKWTPFDKKILKEALGLGLPIGLQVFAEVAIFAVVGLLMAKFSSQIIASHQAAMNFSTLMYAFPLSISMSLPILISYELGGRRPADAQMYAKIGRLVALVFVVCTMTFLYFFREKIAGLFGQQPDFIQSTAHFLTYAFFFQLADSFTAPIQGILRGYKDTTMPFIIGVSSYWLIVLPLALLLDNVFGLGPVSYWIGLIVGIFACGLLLQKRLKRIESSIVRV